ncbi:MAG: hypothetical protein K0Q94_485 [Paenibacillus sp.]|nr:hypothetical protein [Paenibacillus sp.]
MRFHHPKAHIIQETQNKMFEVSHVCPCEVERVFLNLDKTKELNYKVKRVSRIVLTAILAAYLFSTVASAQDSGTDIFMQNDKYNNGIASSMFDKGPGNSNYGMAGSYSWSETYFLESYMNMYESNGDKFWLDKVAEHGNRLMANAFSINGSSNLGWPEAKYSHLQLKNPSFSVSGALSGSAELIANGDFESDADADQIPDGWTQVGGAGMAKRAVGAGIGGTAGVVVESDGTNSNRLVQSIPVTPGMIHTVEVFASVETELTQALIEIYDLANNRVLYSNPSAQKYVDSGVATRIHHVGYERYVFQFVAPPSTNPLQLRLGLQDDTRPGYKAYFDNVSVKAVEHTLFNGSMETLPNTGADTSMPLHWSRWALADPSNVMISSDAHSGSRSIKIVTDNTTWKKAQQVIDYIPGQTYTLSYWGKVSGLPGLKGRVSVTANGNVLVHNFFDETSWTQHSFTFTAPSEPGQVMMIELYQSSAAYVGFTAYFDDIVLTPGLPPKEFVSNGGFQTVTSGLPNGWSLSPGTTTSDISFDTNSVSGRNDLVIHSNTTSSRGLEQTIATNYTPGYTYFVSFEGYSSALNGNRAYVDIYDVTAGTALYVQTLDSTSLNNYKFSFTAPGTNGHTLKIRLQQPEAAVSTSSYFNLLSMKPLARYEASGWTRVGTTKLVNAHQRFDPLLFNDSWGYELISDSTSQSIVAQRLWNYKPNVKYGLQFSAKTSGSSTIARARIADYTSNSTGTTIASLDFSTTDNLFKLYGFDFTTPATAGRDLRVEFSIPSGASGDTLWIDDANAAQYFHQMVDEANIGSSLLRFANLVYDNATLSNYKTTADAYVDFVANNLVDTYDNDWVQITGTDLLNNGSGIYTMPGGFSTERSPARSLPHNQYLTFARMLYLLYDATDPVLLAERNKYLSRANDMMRAFKNKLVTHPLDSSSYNWHYWAHMGDWDNGLYSSLVYQGEDTSHAGITMLAVLEAYRHGQVFSHADIQAFTNTMTKVMWNGSTTDPLVSGQTQLRPSTNYLQAVRGTNSSNIHYWSQYAEIDNTIYDMVHSICTYRNCGLVFSSNLTRFSPNKLINSGFTLKNPADSTLPQGWSRFGLTDAAHAYYDSSDKAVVIKTQTGVWTALEYPILNYEPNTRYEIVYTGKRVGTMNGRIDLLVNNVLKSNTAFSNTNWVTNKFMTDKTPITTGQNVKIHLKPQNTASNDQEIRFDNVFVYPYNANSQIPNSGFETADPSDSTLPLYWQRGSSTSAGSVVLDSSAGNYESGSKALKLVSSANSDSQELVYTWYGYKSGGAYDLEFWAKTTGAAGGKVTIVGGSVNESIVISASASWPSTPSTYSFTAPTYTSAQEQLPLIITVTHQDKTQSGTLWVDGLSIKSHYTYPY